MPQRSLRFGALDALFRSGLLFTASLLASASACGIQASPPEVGGSAVMVPGPSASASAAVAPPASTPAPSTPLLPSPSPPSPIPSSPPPPPPALVCGTTALCLDVEPPQGGGQPTPGKLMVVWRQPNGNDSDPLPEVAFQTPFAGTETRIEIPLAQIKAPSDPANLLCARACGDEATCPCTGTTEVGSAVVLVLADTDGDGQITLAYRYDQSEPVVGVGQVLVAQSAAAHQPAPAQPGFWQNVFLNGIEQGVRPYAIVNKNNGEYQRYGAPAATGTAYKLQTCDAAKPSENCDLRVPKPM